MVTAGFVAGRNFSKMKGIRNSFQSRYGDKICIPKVSFTNQFIFMYCLHEIEVAQQFAVSLNEVIF